MYKTLILIILLLNSCQLNPASKFGEILLENKGEPTKISFLTFNVLSIYDVMALVNGYLPWAARKKGIFSLISKADPDILFLQECNDLQLKDFEKEYYGRYAVFAKRKFSPDAAILYDAKRFEVIEKGHVILERLTEFKIPRIALWMKLRDINSKKEFMIINTHLDAKGLKHSEISTLFDYLKIEIVNNPPIIFGGDMNLDPRESGFNKILEFGFTDSLSGSFLKTFPRHRATRRVDHIFYMGGKIEVVRANTLRGMKILSDHVPVFVELMLK